MPFALNAQQLGYGSNFSEVDFMWNPAMTATLSSWELGATYRQQWLGFEDAPITGAASFQFPFIDKNMSMGTYITLDRTHPLKSNAIAFTYAYKLRLNIFDEDQLSIGVMASLSEMHIDSKRIVVNDYNDELLPNDESSQISPNGGFGIYYQSYAGSDFEDTYFYLGAALNQFLGSDLIFNSDGFPTNLKRTIHGNAIFGLRVINDYLAFEPSAWVNYSQPNIYNVNIGIKIENYESFWAGASFSTNRTLSVQAGLILKKGLLKDGLLRIGTLATYNIGKVGPHQGVGYECYIAYRFDQE